MIAIRAVLLLGAIVCFLLTGLEVKASRLDFQGVGLMLLALVLLLYGVR